MTVDVRDLLSDIATSLKPERATVSEALVDVIVREVPELDGDRAILDLLTQSVARNVAAALHIFESGLEPDALDAPAQAVEYARRLAQHGTPLSALLRAYRLGQAAFQERMIAAIGEATQDNDVLVAASLQLSRVAFGYVDRVSEQVVAAYQSEHDRWIRNRIAARTARVISLLQDRPPKAPPHEVLGYSLAGRHVGAIIWTDDRRVPADPLARLERAVSDLAAQFAMNRPPLFIALDETTIWAWFTAAHAIPDRVWLDDDGVLVALGEPGDDLDGFRETHRQARKAQAVALASARRHAVTRYAEVGLVELMCTDLDAVRCWVSETLGSLAADDPETARLRETVRQFLLSGGSYSATGQALQLHRNTVQYRIRKVERARGRSLHEDRLDVEVALRIIDCLGSNALRPR